MERIEWNHFMTILLLDPYFKINGWTYRGILRVLVKESLNLILFPLIPLNFEGNENHIPLFGSLRLRLGVYKGIEWNGHNGMEMNGMEWSVFK